MFPFDQWQQKKNTTSYPYGEGGLWTIETWRSEWCAALWPMVQGDEHKSEGEGRGKCSAVLCLVQKWKRIMEKKECNAKVRWDRWSGRRGVGKGEV